MILASTLRNMVKPHIIVTGRLQEFVTTVGTLEIARLHPVPGKRSIVHCIAAMCEAYTWIRCMV